VLALNDPFAALDPALGGETLSSLAGNFKISRTRDVSCFAWLHLQRNIVFGRSKGLGNQKNKSFREAAKWP
jgi:hypothetical protein